MSSTETEVFKARLGEDKNKDSRLRIHDKHFKKRKKNCLQRGEIKIDKKYLINSLLVEAGVQTQVVQDE